MKNIVLLDQRGLVINSLLKSKIIKVDTVVLTSADQLARVEGLGTTRVLFRDEGLSNSYLEDYDFFDYELLYQFKRTELKVLSYFSRFTDDVTVVRYLYAAALFYWIKKFRDEDLDGVFCHETEHGGLHDSVILDVASYFGKKVFIKSNRYGNYKGNTLDTVFDYCSKKYVDLSSVMPNKEALNLKDFLFNSDIEEEKDFSASKRQSLVVKKRIKSGIVNFIENRFGTISLILLSKLLRKYNQSSFGFDIPISKYLNGLYTCRMLNKYYSSVSLKGIEHKNYFFMALHMEPEASIQVNTKFSDQLTIAKQVSSMLPDGVFLYIKEHPHQFNMNYPDRSYYLPGVNKFRSVRFYEELLKLPNVRLIDIAIPSEQLISKSKAVLTLSGTASTEAVLLNKPAIMFSQKTSTLALVEGVYDVANSEELNSAIQESVKFESIEYSNFDDIVYRYHIFSDGEAEDDLQELIELLFYKSNLI